jgi:ATP-dependent RNA helicase DeaD
VRQLKEAAQGSIYEGFLDLASGLKKRPDADDLIAFLLRYFFTRRRMERAQTHGETPVAEAREPREGRRSRGERSERHDRDERAGRREREGRRETREERRPQAERDAEATVPKGRPAREAPGAAPRAEKPKAEGGKRKLSDRELFELLKAGKPLPPIDDPTATVTDDAPSEGDERPHREGRERAERQGRRRRGEPLAEVAPGHVRMWVNLGRADALDEAGVSGALEALGAPAGKVAKTELRGTFAYVHVAEADAPAFEALAGKQFREKAVKIERARR